MPSWRSTAPTDFDRIRPEAARPDLYAPTSYIYGARRVEVADLVTPVAGPATAPRRIGIVCHGPAAIWVGDSAVAVDNGRRLRPGDTLDLTTLAAVYAVSYANTISLLDVETEEVIA